MSIGSRVTSCRRTDAAKLTVARQFHERAHKGNSTKKKSSTGPREFLIHKGIAVLFLFQKGKILSWVRKKKKHFPHWRLKLIAQVHRTSRSVNLSTVSLKHFIRHNLVLHVMTQSELFIYCKSFLNSVPQYGFFSSSVLTHVEHWKPLNKFWLILISTVNYTRHVH
jgi:hypothetical protein